MTLLVCIILYCIFSRFSDGSAVADEDFFNTHSRFN